MFDSVGQECLNTGIVSVGYTTVWDINNQTGEIYNKNAPEFKKEQGRRFTLPVDYKTVEFLFAPEDKSSYI